MKDSRAGESLWKEWTGEGYDTEFEDSVVFFTDEHVDVENEIVRRALASALQREGVVVGLGNGFQSLDSAHITISYAGEVDEAIDLTICDEDGETYFGDTVDRVVPITLVEVLR